MANYATTKKDELIALAVVLTIDCVVEQQNSD